jgi:hypothetical protein
MKLIKGGAIDTKSFPALAAARSRHLHQPIASMRRPGNQRSRFAQPIATNVGTAQATSMVRTSVQPWATTSRSWKPMAV